MRRRLLFAAALVLAAALPTPARAATDLQVGIADDRILVSDPERAPEVVERWARIGVRTVRVHVRWIAVAPAAEARRPPADFRPWDHNDPQYDWAFIDRAVDLLAAHGIAPMLAITGSGPVWTSRVPSRDNGRYKPHPAHFAWFSAAVASRYANRVSTYLLWNEPNQPGWLQPQFDCPRPGRCSPRSPHTYRQLVQAAYPIVKAADPDAKVIVGTLAPRGGDPTRRNRPMRPLTFIRAMGCVDAKFKPIRTGPCRDFRPLTADGFSHHPHGVFRAPDEPNPHPDEAAMADLPRLQETLDRTQAAGGIRTPTGAPLDIHLTEFGYQTDPPDTYSGISTAKQKRWLQQARYLAWANPRVKSLVQYEWEDDPIKDIGGGARAYAGWQSGLLFADGRPKPALAAFTNPFWAESRPGATKVRFWGQVGAGGRHTVTLLRREAGSNRWVEVDATTTDALGFWSRRLPVGARADWRFAYDLEKREPAKRVVTVRSAIQRVVPPALLRERPAQAAKRSRR